MWGCEVGQPCNGHYTAAWLIKPWLKQRIGYVPECCVPDAPPGPPTPIPEKPQPTPIPEKPQPTPIPADISARLDRIEKALAGFAPLPGPQGRPGERGPAGAPGPAGPPGRDGASVDDARITALEKELAALKAEKITVRITSNGETIDEDTYPRTGPIVLDFAPIKAVGSR